MELALILSLQRGRTTILAPNRSEQLPGPLHARFRWPFRQGLEHSERAPSKEQRRS